jgi:hypothetical protein
MTLTYGKSSPKDILAKAQRDLSRPEAAEAAEKIEERSDALFECQAFMARFCVV